MKEVRKNVMKVVKSEDVEVYFVDKLKNGYKIKVNYDVEKVNVIVSKLKENYNVEVKESYVNSFGCYSFCVKTLSILVRIK